MKLLIQGVIFFIMAQLYCAGIYAQKPPELRKKFLTQAYSKEFYSYFESINLANINPATGVGELFTTDMVCAITNTRDKDELLTHYGCSWFENFKAKDMTGYSDIVEPLYRTMITELGQECDDDDTCVTTAEKLYCTHSQEKYLCYIEYWTFIPPVHPNPDEPVPGAEPDSQAGNPIPGDPNDPVLPDDEPTTPPSGSDGPGPFEPILNPVINYNLIFWL